MGFCWTRVASVTALMSGLLLCLLIGDPELPQHMPGAADALLHTMHQPYAIETWGEFRQIMLKGDFTAKVSLRAVMAKHPTTGIGALSDARGEITIYDGKLILTYGKPDTPADPSAEAAALLAVGSAAEWQGARVERDLAPTEVEPFLAAAAAAHGIDADKSFPFEIRGLLAPYAMHVNAAQTGGPHGMGLPTAITVERKGDDPIDGHIAGLYVSADLIGIATHGGERTHAHWVSLDLTSTAHLDRWGLRAGAILLLPRQ
jgi:hypothetical protein